MANKDLLPCPFCGGEAFMYKRGSRFGPICFVKCSVCEAQTKVKNCAEPVESDEWDDPSMIAVTMLWNLRTSEKETKGENERTHKTTPLDP